MPTCARLAVGCITRLVRALTSACASVCTDSCLCLCHMSGSVCLCTTKAVPNPNQQYIFVIKVCRLQLLAQRRAHRLAVHESERTMANLGVCLSVTKSTCTHIELRVSAAGIRSITSPASMVPVATSRKPRAFGTGQHLVAHLHTQTQPHARTHATHAHTARTSTLAALVLDACDERVQLCVRQQPVRRLRSR